MVMKDLRSNKEGIEHAVLDVELTMKESKFIVGMNFIFVDFIDV